MTPAQVVEEVKASGIRGRGGAGFPAGLKWSFTQPLPNTPKYVICNADEGEPGTIKDRYIMEGDPHKVLEGIALAGYAVGASRGFIYCRGEYYLAKHRLSRAIEQARDQGLSGGKALRQRFLLRHRSAVGVRLLHLRGGNRAHRIHRRQTRLSPDEAALSRRGRPLGATHHRQ